MNIMKLNIVVLIEKYKKVTDVAAELGLKQPTVSFHMKNLEAELGTLYFFTAAAECCLRMLGEPFINTPSKSFPSQQKLSVQSNNFLLPQKEH